LLALGAISAVLDLSWVHSELAPYYPRLGRPSIDPVLMIWMLILGYVFAIRSERALCRDVRANSRWMPGKQIEQQQATFKRQAAAQVKAWREAADNLRTAGKELAAKHRSEIDATVKRMEVDAATAEEKLQKLNQAGMQSWSALMGALGETRAAFDRANKAAQEAFKRAAP
jgi:transposase-like protein DUF772